MNGIQDSQMRILEMRIGSRQQIWSDVENFNMCSDEILRFKGSEAFKYLGEYKPTPLWETSSKMHHLHIIFGKDTQKKKCAFVKHNMKVIHFEAPQIQKLHYVEKLGF